MKTLFIAPALAGLAAAHSAVWSIKVDGTTYPARDARMDNILGAKRVEWKFADAYNFTWHAVTDVESTGIACGEDATQPELKAFARAGAKVDIQWSNIIRMHNGPVMTYLAPVTSPTQKATELEFFKIAEAGYDKTAKKWANEILIDNDTRDTIQLPSDIKPGLYVLRSDLLALHGNAFSSTPSEGSGPQFYNHCFNIEITGTGTVVPKGVKFPGPDGYKRTDPGVAFSLYKGGQAAKDNYPIPGPPKYNGKYDAPVGPVPQVSAEQTGTFPPEFEAKYQQFKKKFNAYAVKSADFVNSGTAGTRMQSGLDRAALMEYQKNRPTENKQLLAELETLRVEAVKLGIVKEKAGSACIFKPETGLKLSCEKIG